MLCDSWCWADAPLSPIWYALSLPVTVFEWKIWGGYHSDVQNGVLWKMNSRLVCFHLAFSLCHAVCSSSLSLLPLKPPAAFATTSHPPPQGLPVSHSELVTAIPGGLLLLLEFVKHNQRLDQLTRPLTTVAVKHAMLFIRTEDEMNTGENTLSDYICMNKRGNSPIKTIMWVEMCFTIQHIKEEAEQSVGM